MCRPPTRPHAPPRVPPMWNRLLSRAGQGPGGGHPLGIKLLTAPTGKGDDHPFYDGKGGGGQEAAVCPDLCSGPCPSLLIPGGPAGWGPCQVVDDEGLCPTGGTGTGGGDPAWGELEGWAQRSRSLGKLHPPLAAHVCPSPQAMTSAGPWSPPTWTPASWRSTSARRTPPTCEWPGPPPTLPPASPPPGK